CVARHALSRKSSVKRALFSSPLAAQSKHLGATSVVTKSRLSVATTPTAISKVIQLVSWIVDSGCSKHMTGNLQLLRNFIEKFKGTVCFGNDHFVAIIGYLDYVEGNLIICHLYYVKGLGHNLFSVRHGDLEVAFRSNTCYVWNLEGDDLLTGSRDSNLYTISISKMTASSPMCLMSRATSTKSWLWHRRLSHLNFETINQLTSNDLVDGLPKFKYTKDHLCSACEQGKSKKASLPPKLVPSTESKLKLLHMDLCGPIRVASMNDNKYILVIVDDYARYTWMKPKADIGIFIGYSESSRGFRIYNRRTKKIMETIYVMFDELTSMASECNNLEPEINCTNFTNSSEDLQSIPSKSDLDNLFGPLFKEYYSTSTYEVFDDFAANTIDNDHTSSSSSIIVDQDDVPPVVSSSDEKVANAPNSPVINEVADKFIQEDVADFDRYMFHDAPQTPKFEVAESSSTYQDPSNMHQFHQQHRSTDR
ncbi:retrovirus-related pol polyprotein from transposon TNT 1-94, partial [Tanacetum coccineum]